MKRYSRSVAVEAILKTLNIKVFNAKFEIFASKCSVQKSVLNGALSSDSFMGYKSALKNYTQTKKKNRKVVRDLYLNRG